MGEELLYKRHVFGEPSERAEHFNKISSPVQVSQVKDPVDKELERLGITLGYPGKKHLDKI